MTELGSQPLVAILNLEVASLDEPRVVSCPKIALIDIFTLFIVRINYMLTHPVPLWFICIIMSIIHYSSFMAGKVEW